MGHYPFEEGRAGSLRDTHKTAESATYLLADAEIVQLAKEVLHTQVYNETEQTAIQLTGAKKVKDLARTRLMEIVSPPPPKKDYYIGYMLYELTPSIVRSSCASNFNLVKVPTVSGHYPVCWDKASPLW